MSNKLTFSPDGDDSFADDLLVEKFSKLPLLKVNISHFFKPTILGFVNLFASTFFAL